MSRCRRLTTLGTTVRPILAWMSTLLTSRVGTTPLAGLPLCCLVRDDTLTTTATPTEVALDGNWCRLPISHAVRPPLAPAEWRQTRVVLKRETDLRRQPLLTEARSLVERTLCRRGTQALRGLARTGHLLLMRQAEAMLLLKML